MVMSLSRMASVDYLVGHVAAGDGREPSAGSPMTRYYTAEGYPPGTWLGTGFDLPGSRGAGRHGGHRGAVAGAPDRTPEGAHGSITPPTPPRWSESAGPPRPCTRR